MSHPIFVQEWCHHFPTSRLVRDPQRFVFDVRAKTLRVDLDGRLKGEESNPSEGTRNNTCEMVCKCRTSCPNEWRREFFRLLRSCSIIHRRRWWFTSNLHWLYTSIKPSRKDRHRVARCHPVPLSTCVPLSHRFFNGSSFSKVNSGRSCQTLDLPNTPCIYNVVCTPQPKPLMSLSISVRTNPRKKKSRGFPRLWYGEPELRRQLPHGAPPQLNQNS